MPQRTNNLGRSQTNLDSRGRVNALNRSSSSRASQNWWNRSDTRRQQRNISRRRSNGGMGG